MRLLIVEDEITVRMELKTLILGVSEQYEIVGEASNGAEALALLEHLSCDIVITDLQMPEMDGLELLQHISERWQHLKVIVLSNSSEIEYFQTALSLGAAAYIRKQEYTASEITDKLRQIQAEMMTEQEKLMAMSRLEHKMRQYEREIQEKRLRELLQRQWTRGETEELLREFPQIPIKSSYSVTLVQIEDYEKLLENNRYQSERLLTFSATNVFTEIYEGNGYCQVAALDKGQFAIIMPGRNRSTLESLRDAAKSFLKLSVSIGVSLVKDDLFDIHQAYTEAIDALSFRFYRGRSQIIHFEELPSRILDRMEPLDVEPWLQCIQEQQLSGLRKLLRECIETDFESQPIYLPQTKREQLIRLTDAFAYSLRLDGADINSVPLFEGKFPYHVIRSSETQAEITSWFEGWMPIFLTYKKKQGTQSQRSEILTVTRLIKERLNVPLKVAELAAEVGFTENYMSILFKKETGETITEYITRIRMNKAKELLINPDLKIYMVWEKFGDSDPNHFSRSFKLVEGIYPTEYRKLMTGRR